MLKTMLLTTIMIAACATDQTAPSSAANEVEAYRWTVYTQATCANGVVPEIDRPFDVCVPADATNDPSWEGPGYYQAARQALAWKWGCNFQSGRIWEATDEYAPPLTCDIPNTNPVQHAPSWCDAQISPAFEHCQITGAPSS